MAPSHPTDVSISIATVSVWCCLRARLLCIVLCIGAAELVLQWCCLVQMAWYGAAWYWSWVLVLIAQRVEGLIEQRKLIYSSTNKRKEDSHRSNHGHDWLDWNGTNDWWGCWLPVDMINNCSLVLSLRANDQWYVCSMSVMYGYVDAYCWLRSLMVGSLVHWLWSWVTASHMHDWTQQQQQAMEQPWNHLYECMSMNWQWCYTFDWMCFDHDWTGCRWNWQMERWWSVSCDEAWIAAARCRWLFQLTNSLLSSSLNVMVASMSEHSSYLGQLHPVGTDGRRWRDMERQAGGLWAGMISLTPGFHGQCWWLGVQGVEVLGVRCVGLLPGRWLVWPCAWSSGWCGSLLLPCSIELWRGTQWSGLVKRFEGWEKIVGF
jgi:hypothetical protein